MIQARICSAQANPKIMTTILSETMATEPVSQSSSSTVDPYLRSAFPSYLDNVKENDFRQMLILIIQTMDTWNTRIQDSDVYEGKVNLNENEYGDLMLEYYIRDGVYVNNTNLLQIRGLCNHDRWSAYKEIGMCSRDSRVVVVLKMIKPSNAKHSVVDSFGQETFVTKKRKLDDAFEGSSE